MFDADVTLDDVVASVATLLAEPLAAARDGGPWTASWPSGGAIEASAGTVAARARVPQTRSLK